MNPVNRTCYSVVLAATAFALSEAVQAQVNISTAVGNGADTWLDNDDPTKNGDSTTNFGTSGGMEVRNSVNSRMRYALVRFDISGLEAGSDNSQGSISLAQTYGANRSRNWNVYLLRDGYDNSGVDPDKTENWGETTVSYDTCPGITGPGTDNAPAFDTDLDIYDATTNPTGAWELIHTETGWGVASIGGGPATMPNLATTSAIEDAITADTDGQLTFLLITASSDTSNNYGLATKESTEPSTHYPTLVLPNATAGDSDSDGLPDAWEIATFILAGEDPVADAATILARQSGTDDSDTDTGLAGGAPDPDGFNNAAEFAAGSDPLNKLSVPSDIDADGLADLWEDLHFGDNSGTVELTDLTPQDGSGDPDSDWGNNEAEETAATDPNDRASFLDTEGGGSPDGQNDWWEIEYFGDTTTSSAGSDNIDADGHDNSSEYAAYSNPNDVDSVPNDIDGDDVPDLWEDQYYGNNDGIVTDTNKAIDLDGTDGTLNTDGDAFDDLAESTALPVASDPTNGASIPGDADGDGLDDTWELNYFATIFDADGNDDTDGDLYNNEEEEVAGTNPTDFEDFIDVDNGGAGDFMNDRWEVLYFGSTSFTDTDTDDTDSDGFDHYEEYLEGSDPTNSASVPGDLDGDGLDDSFEITSFGSIYDYDGDDDPDRDYATNEEEENAVTDPLDRAIAPDTDNGGFGDGLGDAWEIFSFGDTTTTEDPLDDNDADGHNNAAEFAAASNGNDPLSTPDTDGDNLPDGWELANFILGGEDPVADAATILARQTGEDDSDGGGASNLLEFYAGTDPNDNGSPSDDPTPGLLTTAIGNGADTMLTNDNQSAFYNPGTAHGGDTQLEARNNTAARQRITLLRFDSSTLSGDLSNLMLQIYCNFAPRTRSLPIYGLIDGAPGEDWDEATTTYLTAPGLIPGDVDLINQFARNPKELRPLGTLNIVQDSTGFYLTDPTAVDLKSFIEADTDGIVTLAIAGVDNNQFEFDSKEGAANIGDATRAPALLAPTGTVTPPPTGTPTITAVTLDAGANTFTMSVGGLANGNQYHVESLVPPATSFSAVVGSTFTASGDPEVVVVTADEEADPTQLFRIADGAAPAP